MRGRLPIGKTIEDSRRLLQQTKEAATIEMSFQGIYYLQRALETAAAGQQVLHPLVLGAVSTTVLAACRLGEVVESGGEGTAALQQLAGGMKDALPLLQPLIDEIEKCIQVHTYTYFCVCLFTNKPFIFLLFSVTSKYHNINIRSFHLFFF